MRKDKRVVEAGEDDDLVRRPKRPRVPALASVFAQALLTYNLKKFSSSLEPMIRRVVRHTLSIRIRSVIQSEMNVNHRKSQEWILHLLIILIYSHINSFFKN
ncbi:hypothetical protein Cni_G27836 [Canna indica]|uniref:Uncharacterized protein n=1 Tax=Canna indica TaxID=4628 RepID=A0AAQ3L1U7_9LILI|nr:hypothetical protein Cni_G27836 [Canna indica]